MRPPDGSGSDIEFWAVTEEPTAAIPPGGFRRRRTQRIHAVDAVTRVPVGIARFWSEITRQEDFRPAGLNVLLGAGPAYEIGFPPTMRWERRVFGFRIQNRSLRKPRKRLYGTPVSGPEISPKEWSTRPEQWSDCPSSAPSYPR